MNAHLDDLRNPLDKEALAQLTQLREELEYYRIQYYVHDDPNSDAEFDRLMLSLIKLEKQYPIYADPNHQRVG